MRLLSQISRKYKETEYKKYWIVIPNYIIERLGWKRGISLKVDIQGDKLIIEKKQK